MLDRFIVPAMIAAAMLALSAPASAQPASPAQAAAKYQADVDAYDSFHSQTVLSDDFGDYLAGARHWLPAGAKATGGARFPFNMFPFDITEQKLVAAAALPGAVPEIDAPAKAVLDALRTLNPILNAMSRYASTQAYLDDNYQRAREIHPALVAAVTATLQADKRFGTALNAYAATVDQTELAGTPAGLPHDLLADRLAIRRVQSIVSTLRTGDDVSALGTAITTMAAANDALAQKLNGLSPPPYFDCANFMHNADDMLGSARTLARRAKAGDDPHQPNDFFHDLYPTAMSNLDACLKSEPRARR